MKFGSKNKMKMKMKMNCFRCCVANEDHKKTLKKNNQEHKNNKSQSSFDNLSLKTGNFHCFDLIFI